MRNKQKLIKLMDEFNVGNMELSDLTGIELSVIESWFRASCPSNVSSNDLVRIQTALEINKKPVNR